MSTGFYFGITYSSGRDLVQEAIDYAVALAAERGLMCYDPPVPHSALGHRGDVPYETPITLKRKRPGRRRLNYEVGIKPRPFIQECPMIKIFGYLKRKPGLSPQEFADYYEHNHVPLVLSKAFMPIVYKRNYIQRGDAFNIEGDEISFDCMTELVFADRDDLSAWMAGLGGYEIARDEENFIDRAATRAYVVDERTTAN